MKNNSIKKLLSLIFSIIFLVPCPAVDTSPDEETIEELEASADIKPSISRPLETSLAKKIPAAPIAQSTPTTSQEKLEQDILATMQELKSVAQELSAFTKSPEAQKIRDEKKKKRDEIEKRAEQQRKARLERASHWRPSTSSYSPSYGPSRWGGDPWDRSSRGDRGWTPSSEAPSWTGEPPSKLTTPEELKKDTTLAGKSDDKTTTGEEKEKGRRGATVYGEQEKEILHTYSKLVSTAKTVANKLQAALAGLENKKDVEAGKELLTHKRLSGLSGELENVASSYETLQTMMPSPSEESFKNFDNQRKNILSKELKRIDSLLSGAFKPLLYAATLNADEGLRGPKMKDSQKSAQAILQSSPMEKHISQETIDERAKTLINLWETKKDSTRDVYRAHQDHVRQFPAVVAARPGAAFSHANIPVRGINIPSIGAGATQQQTKQALIQYFQTRMDEIEALKNKFPAEPKPLQEKIKAIDKDLQLANELP